jgi:hypothetical protein
VGSAVHRAAHGAGGAGSRRGEGRARHIRLDGEEHGPRWVSAQVAVGKRKLVFLFLVSI